MDLKFAFKCACSWASHPWILMSFKQITHYRETMADMIVSWKYCTVTWSISIYIESNSWIKLLTSIFKFKIVITVSKFTDGIITKHFQYVIFWYFQTLTWSSAGWRRPRPRWRRVNFRLTGDGKMNPGPMCLCYTTPRCNIFSEIKTKDFHLHTAFMEQRDRKRLGPLQTTRTLLWCDEHETNLKDRFRIHSHLRFIRRELLHELLSPRNHKKWVPNPLLNFSVHAKVGQIASVNAPVCSTVQAII